MAETIPFGFSWLLAVSLRIPPIMRVGFPWISLDSLVRIETYQWVTRTKRAKIFLSAFAVGFEAPERSTRSRPYGSAGLSMGQPNLFSDFPEEIVAEPFPLAAPIQKQGAL